MGLPRDVFASYKLSDTGLRPILRKTVAMKKTEKIELRVDHAEKERLSAIAERRGQTVSDVVRDALAGELGVARVDYPKWPGKIAIGAALLSIAALGLISTVIQDASSTANIYPIYPKSVSADVITGSESISFDITTLKASEHELTIKSDEGEAIRMVITASPDPESNLLILKSDACIIRDQDCDVLDLKTVSVDTRPSRSGNASISTSFGTSSLYISFSAETYWPKPVTS